MNKKLRILIAQINGLVGAIEANADKVIALAARGRDEFHADLIVFPELTLTGYPPEDLLLRPHFYNRVQAALKKVQVEVKGISMVLGYPQKTPEGYFNSAVLIRDGDIIASYNKQCLPNYSVFDEKRYFKAGNTPCVVQVKGTSIGLCICEDLWEPEPSTQAAKAGASILLCLNASPFDTDKSAVRQHILRQRAIDNNLIIVYVNWVGGQDELVFDGDSSAVNQNGVICQQAKCFDETLLPVDFELKGDDNNAVPFMLAGDIPLPLEQEALIYKALITSVRDYVKKNSFPSVVIGLSGGIDSALTLAIARDAIGAEHVTAYMLPSRYTSKQSIELAVATTKLLGVRHHTISIEPAFTALLESLSEEFKGYSQDVTEENIQARCRGLILMAISNKKGALVLSAGNKSEIAVGYCTLYGDMVGGFNVLKDVSKTLVYKLAKYRNQQSAAFPQAIIDRPPTAELMPNQKDQDLLPPYPMLDTILERYIEHDESVDMIVAAGFDRTVVEKVVDRIARNEYKRHQAPVGTRISKRAFGRDRRYPITSGYYKRSLCKNGQ